MKVIKALFKFFIVLVSITFLASPAVATVLVINAGFSIGQVLLILLLHTTCVITILGFLIEKGNYHV